MTDNIANEIYNLVNEIIVERRKYVHNAILGGIQQIATENGFKTEVILNETAIVKAIRNYTPMKPEYYGDGYSDGELVYDYAKCPACGKDDYEYGINNWGCKYCPDCGQALDWSDTE